jgi:crotonobetainyl-CoA:carnitine CoA-transferase CaiB-like acyl-CoA transferase
MAGPLTGYRVVDFSRVLAGPHCAKTLLDLGAEVIKVEPPRGDLSRQAYPQRQGMSGYYAQQNAGKRNLSIDLKVPGAREAVLQLCDTADVIVENFRPGTLATFGLDYASVAARNPRVVYASISGYGQTGAWSYRMAYAATVQAECGFTLNTASQFGGEGTTGDGRLQTDALSHGDVYSGMQGAIAVLAALAHRERTGEGQHIDIAMAAVMTYMNERVYYDLSDEELGAERPILGAHDAPFFMSPDGGTFVSPFSLVGSLTFPFYLAAMRRPDLADDPRFRTPELRQANLKALHTIVQDWMLTFSDMASLDAQLDEGKIATGQLHDIKTFAQSEWAGEWEATRELPDRTGGSFTVPGRPWRFGGTECGGAEEKSAPQAPAWQGEHNAEILRDIGYDDADIESLAAAGALIESGRVAAPSDVVRALRGTDVPAPPVTEPADLAHSR